MLQNYSKFKRCISKYEYLNFCHVLNLIILNLNRFPKFLFCKFLYLFCSFLYYKKYILFFYIYISIYIILLQY